MVLMILFRYQEQYIFSVHEFLEIKDGGVVKYVFKGRAVSCSLSESWLYIILNCLCPVRRSKMWMGAVGLCMASWGNLAFEPGARLWRDLRLGQIPESACSHLAVTTLEAVVPPWHSLVSASGCRASWTHPAPGQPRSGVPEWPSGHPEGDMSPLQTWWPKAGHETGAWCSQTGLTLGHENRDMLSTLHQRKHFFLVNCQQRRFPRNSAAFCAVHSL